MASQAPDAEAHAPAAEGRAPEAPVEDGPSAEGGNPSADAAVSGPEGDAAGTPGPTGQDAATEPAAPAGEADPAGSGGTPGGDVGPALPEATGVDSDGNAPAAEGQDGAADGVPKKRRRSRGKRSGRGGGGGAAGGPGGRRRFAWDEVFLRQRLEILRAMDPDPEAITWAVETAGRFDVADILAGEGSSGREFGRRAYGATPETVDQAAWIVLAAVRARDIVSIARRAVSGTQDQREQVKAAIERLGIARVNTALQGERPAQQVYAERARRVDITVKGGEDQKAAWALLSLARPQDVVSATTPRRPAGGPGGPGGRGPGGPGGPGGGRGPGGFGGDRGGRRERREPPIPGGVFSVGESGIGGELGAKLRAALAAAEGPTDEPEVDEVVETPEALETLEAPETTERVAAPEEAVAPEDVAAPVEAGTPDQVATPEDTGTTKDAGTPADGPAPEASDPDAPQHS